MRKFKIAGIAVATLITVTPCAFAQTEKKSSDTTATQTFTGCLMTEPAYRRAHNLGAGALGGAGLGDEYVLVDAKVSPARDMPASSSPSHVAAVASSSPASTCADQGAAYRMNGELESKLKGLVGRQIEVQGRIKHADDVAADGTRPGEKLPAEVVIVSFREAPAPVAVSEPMSMPAPAPPPPASTVEPTRVPAPAPSPAPAPAPTMTEPRALPRTASPTALLALIGVLALSSGIVLTVLRRRAL